MQYSRIFNFNAFKFIWDRKGLNELPIVNFSGHLMKPIVKQSRLSVNMQNFPFITRKKILKPHFIFEIMKPIWNISRK